MSLEHVKIIQGANLYKELSEECIMCKKRRKKLLQVEMGPISEHQLSVAPAFWACQVDLFGPLMVFVPGFEKRTRNRQVLEAKVWIMTTVCLTTRAVNLQVLEKENASLRERVRLMEDGHSQNLTLLVGEKFDQGYTPEHFKGKQIIQIIDLTFHH